MVDDERTEELNENDAEARRIREEAVEYADRVQAGEEPWREDPEWQAEQQAEKEAQPTDERGNPVETVTNDDVGETGDPDGEVIIEDDGA
jgi:hypothetical protein